MKTMIKENIMNLSQKRLFEIAKNAINELESSEYEHGAILEYLDISEKEFETIKNSNEDTKHYIYTIIFDYSTQDCSGVDTYIFDTYKKALNKFKEIIAEEKKAEVSWVADAFEDGVLLEEDYELDTNIDDINENEEHELWWNITDRDDWNTHDFIDLRIKEVK